MANIRKRFKGTLSVLPYCARTNSSQTVTSMATRRRSEPFVPLIHLEYAYTLGVLLLHRYVAKVIFTYILGYKVDIGHMEAVNLISSSKYSEKQIVSILCV